MFAKASNDGYVTPSKGLDRKTLVYGDKTLMTEFILKKDSDLPRHSHPYEQIGYLVKGHMVMIIGDMKYDVEAGDSWCVPSGLEHGVEILEDSLAIEVFSPVREEYLPEK